MRIKYIIRNKDVQIVPDLYNQTFQTEEDIEKAVCDYYSLNLVAI